ncbi:HD domain-containing protein [Hydrogenimonas thermophila]|uniref:HD domain-containing phosphohydrolase n=1 Tax=Hydrogenimonas thermophila TaxID=223786 RepID=UPI0029374090|nr:HD domain-containing phosphohydrolase [Hydrogenimonas thermophila]WOE70459.1 HD domain-containing protein [Hydrogenimonas thermophila]WOE72976.1 HD domain-containing protein [Hydrogenimonas thermophila]
MEKSILYRFVEYDSNIIVAGGLAADNEQFQNTIVFTENEIFLDGAVAALLFNDELEVITKASFGWVSIGETMTITSSMKNIVYEIDGRKAVDIYAKYLGSDIAKQLPKTGIEFPLLVKRSGKFIPRAVVGKNSDGSLIFAGNLNEGEKVTFGYGNIEAIVEYSDKIAKSQELYVCDSIFIYSCMARKALLRKSINLELSPLNKIAPISGFFTYGEFYTNKGLNNIGLLNQTMTILGLSENNHIKKDKTEINTCHKNISENQTLKALTHLISVTSRELDSYKNRLEERVKEATLEIKELNKELEDTQKEIVFTLGLISEGRSNETGKHIKRVAEYSKLLALYYGLNNDEAELLKQATPMHDIGKIAIPDSILNKPGKLTKDEFELMKKHAEYGYQMINKSNRALLKAAAIIAYEHHEKFDGTGYPRGLKGYEIHIYGRIVALADVFDALSTKRCYKDAWSDDKIKELIINERGKHFDPKLTDIMLEHYDEFVTIRENILDSDS